MQENDVDGAGLADAVRTVCRHRHIDEIKAKQSTAGVHGLQAQGNISQFMLRGCQCYMRLHSALPHLPPG